MLLSCEGLADHFGLIEHKWVGTVRGLSMALTGLLLQWLCLIGCQILNDMCYIGRSIGWLYVRVVCDVAEGSSSWAPPRDALWN